MIFPRSGGVYVFLSRDHQPRRRLRLSRCVETVILLYYAALAASLIVKVGLSVVLRHRRAGRRQRDAAQLGRHRGQARRGLLDRHGRSACWPGLLLASGTRRYFTVQKVLFVVAVAGPGRDRGRDALRQPEHLRVQPDRAHRAGLRGGDQLGHQGRLRDRAHQLQLGSASVPGLAAAAAARRGAVDRHRRRDQEGPPLPAVRHARRGRRHRPADRAVRDPGGQGVRLRVPGRDRLQLAVRARRRLHRGRSGRAVVHRAGRHPHPQRAPGSR